MNAASPQPESFVSLRLAVPQNQKRERAMKCVMDVFDTLTNEAVRVSRIVVDLCSTSVLIMPALATSSASHSLIIALQGHERSFVLKRPQNLTFLLIFLPASGLDLLEEFRCLDRVKMAQISLIVSIISATQEFDIAFRLSTSNRRCLFDYQLIFRE